jgi:hypothetical protein
MGLKAVLKFRESKLRTGVFTPLNLTCPPWRARIDGEALRGPGCAPHQQRGVNTPVLSTMFNTADGGNLKQLLRLGR